MILMNADVEHLDMAVDRVKETRLGGTGDVKLSVYDCEYVMRGISQDEMKERNLLDYVGMPLCNFKYDGTRWTLNFHENIVQNTFKLDPAGATAMGANQTGKPDEVAPSLSPVIRKLESAFDVVSWDFTEVSAASMSSGGHFTDFEFEYVVTGL